MNNRFLRSITVSLALFSVLLMMALPALADKENIKIIIKPPVAIADSTDDSYSATFIPTHVPPGGFFFLDATIPAGYEFILPPAGKKVGTYIMFNHTAHKKQVIITIISNNTIKKTVDVSFSTDYGKTYSTSKDQPLGNMVVGASTLKLTEPTSTTPGYLNISLGGTAGPILKQHTVTLKMAKGTLKNPAKRGKYTWYLMAKNSPTGTPFTGHDDVRIIKKGRSHAKHFDVFDADHPVDASLQLPSGSLTVDITAPPGVDATDLEVTLRSFDEDPIPDEKTGAESLSRFMFIGIDAPALYDTDIPFNAIIRVNYRSVLSSLTVPEANLRLYRFNDTSSEWEPALNGSVDTVNKIVYGEVAGFSTFAVMGSKATPAPISSSGGGSTFGTVGATPAPTSSSGRGSADGGGVRSAEPNGNILNLLITYGNILKSELLSSIRR